MALSLTLRPVAEADIGTIWDTTIERWGEQQATDYLRGLQASFSLLASFPEMARLRQEVEPPVRVHPFREHLIIYRIAGDRLEVLAVKHKRSNWASLLSD